MRRKTRKRSAFFLAWFIAGCLLCTQAPAKASSVQDKDMSPHSIELVAVDKNVKPDNVSGPPNTPQVKIHAAILKGFQNSKGGRCPALAIFADLHALPPSARTDPNKRAAEIAEDLATTSRQADAFRAAHPSVRVVRLPNRSH
jgi:hypothetical protein